jgi:hypothetical protein
VERKEVRRVRPLLSELQVPEWQELAVDRRRPAKVEKGVEEHRYSLVLEAQEVGLFAQKEGQGNSGDGLHHTQGLGVVGGGQLANNTALLPPSLGSKERSLAQHGARIRQDKGHIPTTPGPLARSGTQY